MYKIKNYRQLPKPSKLKDFDYDPSWSDIDAYWFGLERSGKIVAMLGLELMSDCFEVVSAETLLEHRHKGFFSSLLVLAIAKALSLDCALPIRAYANQRSVKAFIDAGFKPIPSFEKDYAENAKPYPELYIYLEYSGITRWVSK